MNILFITENELNQACGGTDRITITLAGAFAAAGHNVFLGFCRHCANPESSLFKDRFMFSRGREREQSESFINDNSIDIVVCNLVGIEAKRAILPRMYDATRGRGAKVVACYHAMPGEDLLGNRMGNSLWRMFHGGKLLPNLKDIALSLSPRCLTKTVFRKRIAKKYRLMYDNGDAVVFHTDVAGKIFASLAGLEFDSKFAAIPSALSYDRFLDPAEIPSKRKEVLLIARMDEKSKRISFALKAWKKISAKPEFSDWKFTIAGDGPDIGYFRRMAKRLKLENLSIEGRVDDVLPLYERASIFLMTSSYEGWGLTLTESQQFGCVPVVLDSFPSLYAVVANGRNGIVSPDNDLPEYVSNVERLMRDGALRQALAANAMEDSHNWEIPKVAGMWLSLFDSLLGKNDLISIIVCTYNRDCYIGQCLERIAACDFPTGKFEIVLVDNKSTDNTASECSSFAGKHPQVDFRYILETRQGLSYARNRGISEARGEVLVFLDDDSFVEPDYLTKLSRYLNEHPEADAFGGRIDPVFESGKAPEWLCKWTFSWVSAIDNGDDVVEFSRGRYPIGANMGLRRSALGGSGMFDTSLGRTGGNLLGGEEKEMFSRLAASGGKILYFPGIRVRHIIPERRTTRDYIVRFARGIGYSEFVRCGRKGWSVLFRRRIMEIVKWCASVLLWVAYLIKGRRICGDMLLLFRWNVSKALFFPESVEI